MSSIRISSSKHATGYFLFFLLLAGFQLKAANEFILNPSAPNSTKVLESTSSGLTIINTISSFNTQVLDTEKGEFIELLIQSYSKTNKIGAPQLPVLSKLVEIPEGSSAETEVISFELKEYKLSDFGIAQRLIPTQAPQSKSMSQHNTFEYNRNIYETNSYYSEAIAKIEVAGNLRGVQLANLILAPIAYNPVTNTIRVYDKLVVRIKFSGTNQLKSVENKAKTESPYYKNVFSNVLNYKPANTRSESISGIPVKYVIVSDPMFKEALQPFIQWKTKRGFNVIQAYTDDPAVGKSLTSIKAYLQHLYTSATPADPAPTFILFVGDVAQIPAFTCGTHVSDLYYCEYTGDYLPEVFYGRFSANTIAELLPQINKTLQYEQYLMPDPSYLNDVVIAAGADASHQMKWGNGQVNYGTTYYFNEAHKLVPHTYLQPEPAGSNYSKNIQANISQGIAFANYSAHGSPEGWADPTFTISDIAKLQNDGKYGLIIGNSCQSNAYDQNSFGEALLRAENKGALGYIGASDMSYWDEDYWWSVGNGPIVSNPTYSATGSGAYDRIFHDHGESRSEWYSTMGQMVFAGNLAVQESNSDMKKYYWEIYCLMGDPSTMIYFGVPAALKVDYAPILPLAASVFEVHTEPYASVAVSKNSISHGVAEADENGLAVVSLQPFTDTGYAEIVVTMQNRKPYIDSVRIETPKGPYLALQNAEIKDPEGNNNNIPEWGETLNVNITIQNLGISPARKAISKLSTTDEYFTMLNDANFWPYIGAASSASAGNAFKLQVSDHIPDLHKATFTISTQTDSCNFSSDFNVLVYAPKLVNGEITFNDSTAGNGNRQIDPGETLFVTMPVSNTGHSTSAEVSTQLFVFADNFTTYSDVKRSGTLTPGATVNSTFHFNVSPDARPGDVLYIYIATTAGLYNSVSTLTFHIGPKAEDFETGLLKYKWEFEGEKPWEIDSNYKSQGVFASKSGTISHSEKSKMFLEGQVLFNDTISFYQKVSSEPGYDFLKFYIDGTELGSWSGNQDWMKVSYAVKPGHHRFIWSYEKDEATSSGLDAAWIDYIQMPALSQVIAGPLKIHTLAVPDTICAGEQSHLCAFASGGTGEYAYSWNQAGTLRNSELFFPTASPQETVDYEVRVNSGPLSANASLTVFVEQLPAKPVITVTDDQLVSSAIAGNQWYNSLGMIPGANEQKYFAPSAETYYVISTAQACPSPASNDVTIGFTAIKSAFENNISVYPNPFSEKLYITYNLRAAGRVNIQVWNSTGTLIRTMDEGSKTAGNHITVFEESNLAAGIYTFKIFAGNDMQVFKMIKN